jgi:hypothetical protein
MAGLLTSYELDCGQVEGEGLLEVGVCHLVLETSSDYTRSESAGIGSVQVLGRIVVPDMAAETASKMAGGLGSSSASTMAAEMALKMGCRLVSS